eukprot:4583772-Pyramimonas_sp.AAC.1
MSGGCKRNEPPEKLCLITRRGTAHCSENNFSCFANSLRWRLLSAAAALATTRSPPRLSPNLGAISMRAGATRLRSRNEPKRRGPQQKCNWPLAVQTAGAGGSGGDETTPEWEWWVVEERKTQYA